VLGILWAFKSASFCGWP